MVLKRYFAHTLPTMAMISHSAGISFIACTTTYVQFQFMDLSSFTAISMHDCIFAQLLSVVLLDHTYLVIAQARLVYLAIVLSHGSSQSSELLHRDSFFQHSPESIVTYSRIGSTPLANITTRAFAQFDFCIAHDNI